MTIRHIEVHWLETARDAEYLSRAGLPRLDIEPTACSSCNARVGEVNGTHDAVFWKPCGIVLTGDTLAVICRGCFNKVDKALAAA